MFYADPAEAAGVQKGDSMQATAQFMAARDQLLRARANAPLADFRWPRFTEFNWVRDYFDVIARQNEAPAL
ncbi:hypothetical protein ACTUM1_15880, partial [Listeria monocytogenes]|uniref:hypothetical protein n=1 Tax=Listeria monocytogenes TaxID=1639 RepID=UPI003FA42C6B